MYSIVLATALTAGAEAPDCYYGYCGWGWSGWSYGYPGAYWGYPGWYGYSGPCWGYPGYGYPAYSWGYSYYPPAPVVNWGVPASSYVVPYAPLERPYTPSAGSAWPPRAIEGDRTRRRIEEDRPPRVFEEDRIRRKIEEDRPPPRIIEDRLPPRMKEKDPAPKIIDEKKDPAPKVIDEKKEKDPDAKDKDPEPKKDKDPDAKEKDPEPKKDKDPDAKDKDPEPKKDKDPEPKKEPEKKDDSDGAVLGERGWRPARVVVKAPLDAEVTANGMTTPRRHEREVFLSPDLEPGRGYSYLFRAEVVRNGERVTRTRRVTVRAGESSEVDFGDLTVAGGERARVMVVLPAGATLRVNGQAVESPKPRTLYETPRLAHGQVYTYALEATLGRGETRTRRVAVEAGKEVTVDFTEPGTQTARR